VTAEIKHLSFKGIEKKEQILFKSFLNLAKNELEYQVVILKDSDVSGQQPDIVIADSSYNYKDDESDLGALPTIRIGNDSSNASSYIVRPVQWSDFKTELTLLDLDADYQPKIEGSDALPKEMEFAIVEMDEKSESDDETSEDYSEDENYDYELDKLSIDYHSFTNSEYLKVVDDVHGFKGEDSIQIDDDVEVLQEVEVLDEIVPEEPVQQEAQEVSPPTQPVILVTDDESASNSSVLILETNSLDAWDMSEASFEEGAEDDIENHSIDSDSSYVDAALEAEITKKLKSGSEVSPGTEFWLDDAEIYSDRQCLLFIKPERDMVYAANEPGKWTALIRQHTITKVALSDQWRPTNELKAYPVSSLIWANTIATKSGALIAGLDSQTEYILESWPHFDLIELDNMLLKLCTMLFVKSESPYSLMQKSGYSRTVVYGLVNACHELGILKVASEFDVEKVSQTNSQDGMFGKIKDVFRS